MTVTPLLSALTTRAEAKAHSRTPSCPCGAPETLADRPDATVVRHADTVAKAHAPDTPLAALAPRLATAAHLPDLFLPPLGSTPVQLHGRLVTFWPYGTPVDPDDPDAAPWEAAATLLARLHRTPAPTPLPPMRGPTKAARAMARLLAIAPTTPPAVHDAPSPAEPTPRRPTTHSPSSALPTTPPAPGDTHPAAARTGPPTSGGSGSAPVPTPRPAPGEAHPAPARTGPPAPGGSPSAGASMGSDARVSVAMPAPAAGGGRCGVTVPAGTVGPPLPAPAAGGSPSAAAPSGSDALASVPMPGPAAAGGVCGLTAPPWTAEPPLPTPGAAASPPPTPGAAAPPPPTPEATASPPRALSTPTEPAPHLAIPVVLQAWFTLPAWARGEAPMPDDASLCHGDLHLGQLVRHPAPDGPWLLIDVDDLGTGVPAWDLARPAAWYACGLLPPDEWARFLGAYRAAGGPAVPADGDPWPALDVPARALTVQTAARAVTKAITENRPLDEIEVSVIDACARMSSLPPELPPASAK